MLLITIAILTIFGVVMLAGASGFLAQKNFNDSNYYLFRQVLRALLPGLIAAGFLYAYKIEKMKRWLFPAAIVCFLLMFAVFIPGIGVSAGGASRWVKLWFFQFQPAEFFKFAGIAYFAYFLSEKKLKKVPENLIFFAFLAVFLIPVILQKDLSTLIVTVFSIAVMYFVSEVPLRNVFVVGCIAALCLGGLAFVESYRVNRIKVLFDPDIDPMGLGYHVKQSTITIGSGGLWGVGLGMSKQKIGLPQPMTDSIFAVIAEEIGLLGALVLIMLFCLFAWEGLKVSQYATDKFQRNWAAGITSWIVLQALINIGSAVCILPVTGLPLPFISYGGTALLAELMACGILLNISKEQQ